MGSTTSSRCRWIVRAVQIIVVAAVLVFVARSVVILWPEISRIQWEVSPPLIACAFVVGLACQGLLVVGWRLSLRLVGADITWRGATTSQLLGQLAKYVPGKVLTLIGKVYLASRAGVPESQAALAMFVEASAQVLTALAVGSVYILALRPSERGLLPVAAVAVVGFVVILHPVVLPRALRTAFRLAGRKPASLEYQLWGIAPLAACYLVLWLLIGIGLWILCLGLGLQIAPLPLTAGYAVSWAAGFLSFIFPAGLGVREYTLATLLGPAADAGGAMSIALASRAWVLAAELLCAAFVWVYAMASRSRSVRGNGADSDKAITS